MRELCELKIVNCQLAAHKRPITLKIIFLVDNLRKNLELGSLRDISLTEFAIFRKLICE